MKKRELIRRWGILFLTFALITGTVSVPSYTVHAGEADSHNTSGEEYAQEAEPEPEPEPEPETPSEGDDGGDNAGTGGGGSPAQSDDDEGGDYANTGNTGADGGSTTGGAAGTTEGEFDSQSRAECIRPLSSESWLGNSIFAPV